MKKVLYSDIKKPEDNSLAVTVVKIMGILTIVALAIIVLFGG